MKIIKVKFDNIEAIDIWRSNIIKEGATPKITAKIVGGKHIYRGYAIFH